MVTLANDFGMNDFLQSPFKSDVNHFWDDNNEFSVCKSPSFFSGYQLSSDVFGNSLKEINMWDWGESPMRDCESKPKFHAVRSRSRGRRNDAENGEKRRSKARAERGDKQIRSRSAGTIRPRSSRGLSSRNDAQDDVEHEDKRRGRARAKRVLSRSAGAVRSKSAGAVRSKSAGAIRSRSAGAVRSRSAGAVRSRSTRPMLSKDDVQNEEEKDGNSRRVRSGANSGETKTRSRSTGTARPRSTRSMSTRNILGEDAEKDGKRRDVSGTERGEKQIRSKSMGAVRPRSSRRLSIKNEIQDDLDKKDNRESRSRVVRSDEKPTRSRSAGSTRSRPTRDVAPELVPMVTTGSIPPNASPQKSKPNRRAPCASNLTTQPKDDKVTELMDFLKRENGKDLNPPPQASDENEKASPASQPKAVHQPTDPTRLKEKLYEDTHIYKASYLPKDVVDRVYGSKKRSKQRRSCVKTSVRNLLASFDEDDISFPTTSGPALRSVASEPICSNIVNVRPASSRCVTSQKPKVNAKAIGLDAFVRSSRKALHNEDDASVPNSVVSAPAENSANRRQTASYTFYRDPSGAAVIEF